LAPLPETKKKIQKGTKVKIPSAPCHFSIKQSTVTKKHQQRGNFPAILEWVFVAGPPKLICMSLTQIEWYTAGG